MSKTNTQEFGVEECDRPSRRDPDNPKLKSSVQHWGYFLDPPDRTSWIILLVLLVALVMTIGAWLGRKFLIKEKVVRSSDPASIYRTSPLPRLPPPSMPPIEEETTV